MWSKDLIAELISSVQKIPEGLNAILSQAPAHASFAPGREFSPMAGIDSATGRSLSSVSRSIDSLIPSLDRLNTTVSSLHKQYAQSPETRHTLPGKPEEPELPEFSPAEFARHYLERKQHIDHERLADALKPSPVERSRPAKLTIPKGSPYAGLEAVDRPVEIETPAGIKAIPRGERKSGESTVDYLARSEREALAKVASSGAGIQPPAITPPAVPPRSPAPEPGREPVSSVNDYVESEEEKAARLAKWNAASTTTIGRGSLAGLNTRDIEAAARKQGIPLEMLESLVGKLPESEPFGGTIGITPDVAKQYADTINAVKRAERGPDAPIDPNMPGLKTGLDPESVRQARTLASFINRTRGNVFGKMMSDDQVHNLTKSAAAFLQNPAVKGVTGFAAGGLAGQGVAYAASGAFGPTVGRAVGALAVPAGQIAGAAALGGSLAGLAAGAAVAASALMAIPRSAERFGQARVDQMAQLMPFSGEIAGSMANFGVREMQRNVRLGQATAASTGDMTHALANLKDSLEPMNVFTTNLANRLSAGFSNFGKSLADAAAPIFEGANKLLENNMLFGSTGALAGYGVGRYLGSGLKGATYGFLLGDSLDRMMSNDPAQQFLGRTTLYGTAGWMIGGPIGSAVGVGTSLAQEAWSRFWHGTPKERNETKEREHGQPWVNFFENMRQAYPIRPATSF